MDFGLHDFSHGDEVLDGAFDLFTIKGYVEDTCKMLSQGGFERYWGGI